MGSQTSFEFLRLTFRTSTSAVDSGSRLIRKIAIAAIAAIPISSANAAEPKPPIAQISYPANDWAHSFWYDSVLTIHFRTYVLDRETPAPPGLGAWAGGGWIGYQSGWLANFLRVGAVGYTSQPIWAPDDRDGTLLLKPDQQGYSVFGEAYVSLKLFEQEFTAFRQRVNEPEVNLQDNRMTPNTFEGYTLTGRFGDFRYFAAYLNEMKPRNEDNFLNIATVAGAPTGVSEGMWLGSIDYLPTKDFAARFSSYHVPNILTSSYGDVLWLMPFSDLFKLRVGGQYMFQGSTGADLLTGSTFDTWSAGGKADVIMGPLTLMTAYTQTGDGANYRSPYGSWAGYTSMIVKDFNRANESAWLVGASIDFAVINLPGLSFTTNLVFGDDAINPANGRPVSDNTEYDFTLDYRFTASYWPEQMKPLWIRARAAHIEERLNGVTSTTNDYRIIVNYAWVSNAK